MHSRGATSFRIRPRRATPLRFGARHDDTLFSISACIHIYALLRTPFRIFTTRLFLQAYFDDLRFCSKFPLPRDAKPFRQRLGHAYATALFQLETFGYISIFRRVGEHTRHRAKPYRFLC